MRKKKLNKKKLILSSLFVAGIVVVVTLFSLVFVFAREKSTLQSNISVAYYSNNVSAKVQGKYWIKNSNSKLPLGTAQNGGSEIVFGGDSESAENIVPLDAEGNVVSTLSLTSKNKYVVFEYKFTNLSPTSNFKIELTNSPKLAGVSANYANMTEKYYITKNEVAIGDFSALSLLNELPVQPVMRQRVDEQSNLENDSIYIYVVAEISNIANKAKYSGNFTWSLDYVNPEDLTSVSLYDSTEKIGEIKVLSLDDGKSYNMPAIYGEQIPTKEGFGFAGIYSAVSGGTQYISVTGDTKHIFDLTKITDDYRLYVHWSEYDITEHGVFLGMTSPTSTATQIVLPEGVKAIDDEALMGNTTVTNISLPGSVTEIGASAFEGCTGLTTIDFNGNVASSGNMNYTSSSILRVIGAAAFKGCSNLTDIEIPSTVTSVGDEAFKNCNGISQITIPSSAKVGEQVFGGCSNITITGPIINKTQLGAATNVNLTITGNASRLPSAYQEVEYIESTGTQYIDTGLVPNGNTKVNMTLSLSQITSNQAVFCARDAYYMDNTFTLFNVDGAWRYDYCNKIGENIGISSVGTIYNIEIYGNVFSIDGVVLASYNQQEFTAGSNLLLLVSCLAGENLSWYTSGKLYSCKILDDSSVLIRNFIPCYRKSDNEIGMYDLVTETFYTNQGTGTFLKGNDVDVPTSNIFANAFENYTELKSVSIEKATAIGTAAFKGCTGLTSIVVPDTVTSVGDEAFRGCSGLTSITIPGGATLEGNNTFYGCGSNATPISITGPVYSKAKITGAVKVNLTINGTGNTIEREAFNFVANIKNLTIAGDIETIGGSAFAYSVGMTSITISEKVTTIEGYAFSYSSMNNVSIDISENVTTIGAYAFFYIDGLLEINVSENNQNFSSYDGVLYNKDQTILIVCPGGKTSIEFAPSVTQFYSYGWNFAKCFYLTEIVFPDTLESGFDQKTFSGCSHLQRIVIGSKMTNFGGLDGSFCNHLVEVSFSDDTISYQVYSERNKSGTCYETEYYPTDNDKNIDYMKYYWTRNTPA